jgi:hypothetical protein
MTTEKQIEANKENASHSSGPKTEEGKANSKYNALKHGIFKEVVSDYENEFYENLMDRLHDEFQPHGVLEKLLVDRIGVCYLRLFRAAKAENEFMRATLDPRIVEARSLFPDMTSEEIVKSEGYSPKVDREAVDKLSAVYLRYEITIENRLYKALHELQRIQAIRKGLPNPGAIVLDVGE